MPAMDSTPSSTPAQQQPQLENNDVGFFHIPLPTSRRGLHTRQPAPEMPTMDHSTSPDVGITSPASRTTASTATRSALRSATTSPANSPLQSPPTTIMSSGMSDKGGLPKKANINLHATAAAAAAVKGMSSQTQRSSNSGGGGGGGSSNSRSSSGRLRRNATSSSVGTVACAAGSRGAKAIPTVGLGLHSTGTKLPPMIAEEGPDPVLSTVLSEMSADSSGEAASKRRKPPSRLASKAPPTAAKDEADNNNRLTVTKEIAHLIMNINTESANSSLEIGTKMKSKSSSSSSPPKSSSPQPNNNTTSTSIQNTDPTTTTPEPLEPTASSAPALPVECPNEIPSSPPPSLDYGAWPLPGSPRTRLSQTRATSDSAYDRARGMEIHRSEWKHAVYRFPVKGAKHWVIDCDLTESSHARLSDVARRSSEGFEWTGEYELANIYRVLATVHRQFMEEMRADRLRRVEQMRRDRKRTLVPAGAPVTTAMATVAPAA